VDVPSQSRFAELLGVCRTITLICSFGIFSVGRLVDAGNAELFDGMSNRGWVNFPRTRGLGDSCAAL